MYTAKAGALPIVIFEYPVAVGKFVPLEDEVTKNVWLESFDWKAT